MLTLIAAMDEKRLLADERGIPWHLPRDIAHFRDYTQGKWLLLGRKTFEEMQGWFRDGHYPLVLSARCGWDPHIGRLVCSVPHALALAEAAGVEEIVCCGGAQTYAAALPYAHKLVLTTVHARIEPRSAAVYFPSWTEHAWREKTRTAHIPDAEHAHGFTIATLTLRQSLPLGQRP